MVHALRDIHRLLKPEGILIDIHPLDEAALFEVHQEGEILHTEADPNFSGEDYRQADIALSHVVQQGWFFLERTRQFDFRVYASSVTELRDFLTEANAYEDKVVDQVAQDETEQVARRLEQVMQAAGIGVEVAMLERGRISRLRTIR